MFQPPEDNILPMVRRLLAAGIAIHWDSYYSGPFQSYEHSTTSDHVWDIAPTVAMFGPNVKSILEIGSGSGRLSIPFVQSGRFVTALDKSSSAIKQLLNRAESLGLGGEIAVIESDVLNAEVDMLYDAVSMVGLSVHVMDLLTVQGAISLARRALKPGGTFCMNIFGRGADRLFGRLMPKNGNIAINPYLDENLCHRLMISSGRYNSLTREITENWITQSDDGMIHGATMVSNLWKVRNITQMIVDAGFIDVRVSSHPFGTSEITKTADVDFIVASNKSI